MSTADQVLEKIGSFGRYQLILLIFANMLAFFWYGWPLLITTFIAAEPGWRCVRNSSECTVKGTVQPWADTYDDRCNMSRGAWTFDADYTSVVTQVSRAYSVHYVVGWIGKTWTRFVNDRFVKHGLMDL